MSLKSGWISVCGTVGVAPTLACQALYSSLVVSPYRITSPDITASYTTSTSTALYGATTATLSLIAPRLAWWTWSARSYLLRLAPQHCPVTLINRDYTPGNGAAALLRTPHSLTPCPLSGLSRVRCPLSRVSQ